MSICDCVIDDDDDEVGFNKIDPPPPQQKKPYSLNVLRSNLYPQSGEKLEFGDQLQCHVHMTHCMYEINHN